MKKEPNLSRSFRKLTTEGRRRAAAEYIGTEIDLISSTPTEYIELADIMVENSIGIMGIPLGIAPGFSINGRIYHIPMATEEPSVIAAASYSAGIVAAAGGFTAHAADPVMSFQIFFPLSEEFDIESWLTQHLEAVEHTIRQEVRSLEERGGGYRETRIELLKESRCLKMESYIDVCDAMGANRLNTTAERISSYIEKETGIKKIMAILSNAGVMKRAASQFSVPLSRLARIAPEGLTAEHYARRIVTANDIAKEDPSRAVTHNKGIMNGITALALATGNDTRAVESAVHSWAARRGRYTALTDYRIEDGALTASIDIPTAFAAAGGAVQFHPTAIASLKILGNPDVRTLSMIAASLGLAQNFAALLALTGKGIQAGHMRLHGRKLAYLAGARGTEIDRTAETLHRLKRYTIEAARQILEQREEEPEDTDVSGRSQSTGEKP